jgi:hypothetical protein
MTFYDRLRTLLDWRGEPGTRVLSLYLDIAGPGEEKALNAASTLWDEAREGLDDDDFFDHVSGVLDALPGEIAAAQAAGYDGLAVFACPKPHLRETFRLRFALENQIEVSHEPQTWQLAYYEEEYEPAVALSLGPKPTIFELHVGDVVAHHPVRPSHGRSIEQEARAELHLLLRDSRQSHLILLGPAEERARLLATLEPSLRARLIGELDEALTPESPGFLRAIHRVQQAYERRSEAAGVQSLLAARSKQDDAAPVAAGTAEVIDAINQGRIQKLYMLQSFDERGWLCDACDRLGLPPAPPACTACGASVGRASLHRHLIQQARACGAEIETVYESAELASLGSVAAELLPR